MVEPDEDQEAADAEALGLELDQVAQASKKRRLSGPKVRRSREEVLQEDTERLNAKFDELLSAMNDPTSPMPTVAMCAKILRSISSKTEESRGAGAFQCVTSLESLSQKLNQVKEALRVSSAYIQPSGNVKKTQEEPFVQVLEQLPQDLLSKLPASTLDRFYHLVLAKDALFALSAFGQGSNMCSISQIRSYLSYLSLDPESYPSHLILSCHSILSYPILIT